MGGGIGKRKEKDKDEKREYEWWEKWEEDKINMKGREKMSQ